MKEKVKFALKELENCVACPRNCKVNRLEDKKDILWLVLPSLILVKSLCSRGGMDREQFSLVCATYAVSFVKIGIFLNRKEDGS